MKNENLFLEFIEQPQVLTEKEMEKVLGGEEPCLIRGCNCKSNFCAKDTPSPF